MQLFQFGFPCWDENGNIFVFFFLTHTRFKHFSTFIWTVFPHLFSCATLLLFTTQFSTSGHLKSVRCSSIHSYISCAINRPLMHFLFCVTQIFYKIRKQAHKYLTQPVFRWESSLGQITCRHEDSHFFFHYTSRCTLFDKKAEKRGHAAAVPTPFDWKCYFLHRSFFSVLFRLRRKDSVC